MQMDNLPSTQLVGSSSVKSFPNEKEDTLPCTQLADPVSSMEMEDLPCTQFVVPAPIKDFSVKEEDALPATRPSSPMSPMQADDLPYIQLVESSSKNSVSRMGMDDLPCTQLATQSVTPEKYSKRKADLLPATQPTSQIQANDLPCTHLVEPSSKNFVSIEEDALPCTQLVESSSNNSVSDIEEDTLPCTQLARPLFSVEMEELPCTQLTRPLSNMQTNNLSSTQFLMPAPVKYPPKRKVDSLPATQPTSSLSQTQTDDLPCTQIVESSSKNSFSHEEDALPSTQLLELSSKTPVSDEEGNTLPCTQLAKPVSSREVEDLPCTQLARPLSNSQMDDLPGTQFAMPAPVNYPIKKKGAALPAKQPSSPLSQIQMDDLPCTQLVEPSSLNPFSDKEEDSLPCTQLATPMSSLHSRKSQNTHAQSKELPAFSGEQGHDTNVQTKQKQSDNFQEDKNCQENLPATQQNTSIEHCTENSDKLNSNFNDDFDLPETQPLTFNQHHSNSKKLLQENSNDEQATDEELLSNIDKLKIKKTPAKKVVGIHKNLPQVLMPIPSRRIPIPKPSNRNTFSFDQVKPQYDVKDNKNSLKGNLSFGRILPITKIGDLSTKGTESSVLKKELQISSECKAENTNNFKKEKSPLVLNERGILVSSVPNSNVEVKVDKSNVPLDSEIEIIDDAKIMEIKNVEEFVLSSDEEDLPATQFCDRTTNQCSSLPNQKKLEKVVVKKEITLNDFQVENVKALNSLSVKQEKCEENILRKIKMEPLQKLQTEEKISRLIKSENKSLCSEDITMARRNIQCADKSTNQKISSTKSINNDNVSRSFRSHEKQIRGQKSKTDLTDHNMKTVRDRSSSSDIKVEFEKERKRKTEGSSEIRIHSNIESRIEIKTENRSLSKTNSNSNIKLNTENVNKLKLVNKDKKPKSEHISSSPTHANGEHIKHHKLVTEKPKSISKEESYHGDSKRQKHSSLNDSKKVQDHKIHNLVTEKPKSSLKENYHEDSKRQKRDSLDDCKKVQGHKNSKLVTEKSKSSSKEDNYHEDSKRRNHDSLDNSKKMQNHKKLKMDTLTIKNELSPDKNGKHDFEKSFNNKKESHTLKNIKTEDSFKQKSSRRSLEPEQMSNSGKIKETHVSNGEKSRNNSKDAKAYNKPIESQNSNKSSQKNLKVMHSNSRDNKRNGEYLNSDYKGKEVEAIPFNDKEMLNSRIKSESDSEKKVSNQLKASKTNLKNESSRAGSVVKRSGSSEGERNTKRPRLDSLSCNEDTSDCHSDYSRSSVISSESNFRKKYKHQRNALNSLNEIADEIISTSKNCNTDILNQDENMDIEVIKRSKDPSSLGRKVDKAHLKDEIAAEVKIALKPFYSVGLIDKEDYKDIMRKAVPKIYMNCGNYVHPEKIKNLVTGYVKKLTNS